MLWVFCFVSTSTYEVMMGILVFDEHVARAYALHEVRQHRLPAVAGQKLTNAGISLKSSRRIRCRLSPSHTDGVLTCCCRKVVAYIILSRQLNKILQGIIQRGNYDIQYDRL